MGSYILVEFDKQPSPKTLAKIERLIEEENCYFPLACLSDRTWYVCEYLDKDGSIERILAKHKLSGRYWVVGPGDVLEQDDRWVVEFGSVVADPFGRSNRAKREHQIKILRDLAGQYCKIASLFGVSPLPVRWGVLDYIGASVQVRDELSRSDFETAVRQVFSDSKSPDTAAAD